MNALTRQIIRRLEALPARKKAAMLELLRSEASERASSPDEERAAWKASLRDFSVWSEEDLEAINEARSWMNRWTPKSW